MATPLSPEEWLLSKGFDPNDPDASRTKLLKGGEDEGGYTRYIQDFNAELFPNITDPQGNIWVAPGQGYNVTVDEDTGYALGGGVMGGYGSDSPWAGLIGDFHFEGPQGATYIPQVIANEIGRQSNQTHGIQGWLDSAGPVMLLGSLLTGGALSGFGAATGAGAVAEGGLVTGAGGAGLSAADALGLQQMAAAAGLPAGSTASEAFIASGGTMGSTAAGGLGGATLAESFGYTTPVEGAAKPWWESAWDTLKDLNKLPSIPALGMGGDVAPTWNAAPAEALTDVTAGVGAAAAVNPALQEIAAPKPGAPDYQSLWESYAGWIDNVNRINEGAFADVRARLSAAGAAPDLIKMQTEHLESQRVQALAEFDKTSTFDLLSEGYDIAVGGKENRYAGGLAPYAGSGKPELMDFYTELYGQPSRSKGGKGIIGTSGTPGVVSQSGPANPWLEDAGNMSLIG